MKSDDRAVSEQARALARGDSPWDRDTDVLVLGGGVAGHCAALEAAGAGRQVLHVEKEATVGGSTVLSGGSMAFAGTDEQAADGIEDSDERLFRDLVEVGEHCNDERLVQTYVAHQRETYRWLKVQGVAFRSVQLGGGQSVPRSNRVDPRQMIAALSSKTHASGVSLITGTAALRLIRSTSDARITGALLRDGSGRVAAVHARCGVVLATGGFSRNEEMLKIFAPAQEKALRIGGPGNVGDGLRMAMALGAGLRDMGFVRGTFGTHPAAGAQQHTLMHAIYKGAIAVNRSGRRFVDESISYKLIGDACLRQPDALAWQIFDQSIMDESISGVITSDFRAAIEAERLLSAPTLEALAALLEIDADGLRNTVDRYNADVRRGRDAEFGRDGLAQHYGGLRQIKQAPFYGYPSTSAVLATYCGVAIDEAAQVLDVFGEPIEGLFAAGEVIGGLHGAAYMTGSSLGKGSIFGRIAGRNAAGQGIPPG
jgi:fumarate reductase flavoprotein subunit